MIILHLINDQNEVHSDRVRCGTNVLLMQNRSETNVVVEPII